MCRGTCTPLYETVNFRILKLLWERETHNQFTTSFGLFFSIQISFETAFLIFKAAFEFVLSVLSYLVPNAPCSLPVFSKSRKTSNPCSFPVCPFPPTTGCQTIHSATVPMPRKPWFKTKSRHQIWKCLLEHIFNKLTGDWEVNWRKLAGGNITHAEAVELK